MVKDLDFKKLPKQYQLMMLEVLESNVKDMLSNIRASINEEYTLDNFDLMNIVEVYKDIKILKNSLVY